MKLTFYGAMVSLAAIGLFFYVVWVSYTAWSEYCSAMRSRSNHPGGVFRRSALDDALAKVGVFWLTSVILSILLAVSIGYITVNL
jgi:hypothetical protein